MRGGLEAARQTRGGGETGLSEIARYALGKPHAGRGRVARTDNRHHRKSECAGLSAHRKERRRVVDCLQPCWIILLAQRDEAHALTLRGLKFTFGIVERQHRDGAARAAAPRQIGQGLERRARTAVVIHKLAECPGTRY